MKQLHSENELSSEVLAILNDFEPSRFDDDDFGDTSWLDEVFEDRFGGDWE